MWPNYSHNNADVVLTHRLAQHRLRAIDDEAKRRAVPRIIPAPEPVVCSCGHRVSRELVMHASLGTACPDCYDRLSN